MLMYVLLCDVNILLMHHCAKGDRRKATATANRLGPAQLAPLRAATTLTPANQRIRRTSRKNNSDHRASKESEDLGGLRLSGCPPI